MDSATITKQLQDAQNAAENPLDIYDRSVNELGVGDVRNRVNSIRGTLLNTENLLNGVDSSVTGRTSGSLVTEAQRQRLVNLERQPLAQQYGQQQSALGNETANLSDLLGQASNRSNLISTGQQQKIGNLKDLLSVATQKEAAARAQAEADRQYQLAMQQFQESQRQFNAQMSLSRQSLAQSGSSNALPSTQAALVSLFKGYKPAKEGGSAWYTEREVIPTLQATYGLSKDAAAKLAYNYRKQVFGE